MERSFDVYGVGHALVDIQYRVDVETLDKLGIEKGVMTLIDSQRQQALFEQLNRDPIVSLGRFGCQYDDRHLPVWR